MEVDKYKAMNYMEFNYLKLNWNYLKRWKKLWKYLPQINLRKMQPEICQNLKLKFWTTKWRIFHDKPKCKKWLEFYKTWYSPVFDITYYESELKMRKVNRSAINCKYILQVLMVLSENMRPLHENLLKTVFELEVE